MYFEQAASSADGTIISLNTMFSSNFQVAHAVNYQKIVLNENNLINILKKNGYHVYGTFPKLTSFNSLRECFENENNSYDWIELNIPPVTLSTGLATKIIQLLESKKQEPCFYYFHIFDLHPLREGRKPIGIENFDNEKFGLSLYERTVSSIDFWLGKILEHVDMNDIIILTADHGERIPHGGFREVDFEPKLEHTVDFGKKLLPKSAHKIGGQFLSNVRKSVGKRKLNKDNQKLTNYQKRSRNPYFTLSLFDEMMHIPLLFVGNLIKPGVITKQVRHVDIFPTICELLGIPLDIKISGKSLVLLANESLQDENPNYLHTMPYQKSSHLDMVGVRTSRYKYFRSAHNANENIHLYDLKNDPYENSNIMKTNKKLVTQFEKTLLEMQKNDFSEYVDEEDTEELKEIEYELRKMGYV
jgi:arylsulfatase A-like enzyme